MPTGPCGETHADEKLATARPMPVARLTYKEASGVRGASKRKQE